MLPKRAVVFGCKLSVSIRVIDKNQETVNLELYIDNRNRLYIINRDEEKASSFPTVSQLSCK